MKRMLVSGVSYVLGVLAIATITLSFLVVPVSPTLAAVPGSGGPCTGACQGTASLCTSAPDDECSGTGCGCHPKPCGCRGS
jgi:hypothetical protein